MQELILTKLAPLLLSATPLSLILIYFLNKTFSKHDPRLGNTTTICTNLIGTLTEKHLMVRTFFFDKFKGKVQDNSQYIKITDLENKDDQILLKKDELRKDEIFRLIATITFLCKFHKTHKIEETILKLIMECEFSKYKAEEDYKVIQRIPSSPEKKLSTIVTINPSSKEIFALTKGNPLAVLKKCTKTTINGRKVDMSHQTKRKIRKRIKQLNKNGQKVIAFAYKPLPLKRQDNYTEQFTENDMTFLGIIGVTNPLKTNLEEPIKLIKAAGIKPYIVTGEKERKAVAIGRIQKLINPQYFEAVTGEYLRQLSDQKISKMLSNKEKDFVFAGLKEKDKARIIELLRRQGETVAVINKDLKTSLKDLVTGIKKGRIINKNYQKYSQHAITCKIAELLLILTAFILKAPTPLSVLLIIILDILINSLLELSLRLNRVEEEVMNPKYHPDQIKLLTKKTLPRLLTNSISIGLIISVIYITSLIRYGWNIGESLKFTDAAFIKSATITFILLILIQIINAFSFRTEKKSIFQIKPFSNLYLNLTTIISLLFVYIFTSFEFFRSALNLDTLSGLEWQIILFCALIILIIEEIRKFFIRKFNT
jgi:Ca2+-transporting ATPase